MKTTLMWAAGAALALTMVSCKSRGFQSEGRLQEDTSSRTYTVDVERAWQAVQSVMRDLDLAVDTAEHDALGGELLATRATGEPVNARVRSVAPNSTAVEFQTERPEVAKMIQDRVAEKLGQARGSAAAVSSGSMAEGTYPNSLDECAAAAERALRTFNLPVDAREKHDIWSVVRSRHLDTIPVSVRMERTHQDTTKVQFSVGTASSDDNRLLVERLKKEFETSLGGAGQEPQQPRPAQP
jgi:hypothetical protein